MTKKKKIINGLIFFLGLIVFAVYYFEDKDDMEAVEEEQDKEAVEAADTMMNDLNDSFNNVEFEENSTISDTVL